MENIAAYRNGDLLRDLDPGEFFLAKRDIGGFYQQQSVEYSLYGDADFGTSLNLPYWDYLDVRNVNEADSDFLRTGSLVIMVAMALEPFEDIGICYLSNEQRKHDYQLAIEGFEPTNSDEQRLKNLITELVNIQQPSAWTSIKHLEKELQWVYVNFIYGYFRNKANSFEQHLEILYQKEHER